MSEDTQQVPDDGTGGPADGSRFRLGYVPGATPGKWARTWRERLPDVHLELVPVAASSAPGALLDGEVDAAVLRLPVDRTRLHAIALYDELPVVVVSREHLLAATTEAETVAVADLADDVVWLAQDDVLFTDGGPTPGRAPEAYDDGAGGVVEPERPATTAEAIALVATGSGVAVVPMSLARLHQRKDVTYRLLDDGPPGPVGLAWLVDGLDEVTAELVEEMVGIVRGRTANSSRGRAGRERAEQGSSKESKSRESKGGKGGKGAGKPTGKSGGKPAGKSGGKPAGKSGGKSSGKPSGRGGQGGRGAPGGRSGKRSGGGPQRRGRR